MSVQMAAMAWRAPRAVFRRDLIACLLTVLESHFALLPGCLWSPLICSFILPLFAHLISQGSLLCREHKVTHYHKLST